MSTEKSTAISELINELKVSACLGTLQEMKKICDNAPVNECKTQVIFEDVRKQNAAINQLHELILQLLDTCKPA